MKTKLYFNPALLQKKIFFIAVLVFFFSCKKESALVNATKVSSQNISQAKTDGIISVQTAILPPVTPQTFITNGSFSSTQFDIVSNKHIFIDRIIFSAAGDLIQSIDIGDGPFPNIFGKITFDGFGSYINAGSALSMPTKVYYNSLDNSTSGTISQLSLYYISYRTDDNLYHDFYPEFAGKAQPMCVVNNVPHIWFQNPSGDTLRNGYKEIAEVKLTGDTSWTLGTLPLNISSPFGAMINNAKLIVRCLDEKVGASAQPVILNTGGRAQSILRFDSGFLHTAGNTEVLKIYAPVTGVTATIISTLGDLNYFVWGDALDTRIGGPKNAAFFKQQTGESDFR